MAVVKYEPKTIGPTVGQAMITDGIANNTKGSVIDNGDSLISW